MALEVEGAKAGVLQGPLGNVVAKMWQQGSLRLYGANLDEGKCYDAVCRPICVHAMRRLGMPEGLLRAQDAFYAQLPRAFSYGEGVGSFWGSQTSIGQGCALSQIYINGLGTAWARYVQSRAEARVKEMKEAEAADGAANGTPEEEPHCTEQEMQEAKHCVRELQQEAENLEGQGEDKQGGSPAKLQPMPWIAAVRKARTELDIKGFMPIRKGTPRYNRAMDYHKVTKGPERIKHPWQQLRTGSSSTTDRSATRGRKSFRRR